MIEDQLYLNYCQLFLYVSIVYCIKSQSMELSQNIPIFDLLACKFYVVLLTG